MNIRKWILCCALLGLAMTARSQRNELQSRKLTMAELLISNLYVDPVDESKLVENAITGMLKELDPHSTYSTPEEVKEMNEPLRGNFEGIGVQFNMATDTLFIIQTISGGPSEKAGIMAGDKIIKVNDTLIAGVKMKTEDIMSRLKGPKGSKVKVSVLRRGVPELLSFTITRDKIPVYSLDAAYMVDNQIGYIRISRFAATTGDEFAQALSKLKKKGMKSLILDLQGNGGGYLEAAISMANQLLEKDELIVYTEGRRSPRMEFNAKGKGDFPKGKLAVLVDEFTASASEIVSGAIQDWDRGTIIGRRTFGKGLVQRPINLPDGSMIRLTISRYYTPSGRCIQKPYDDRNEYGKDLIERYNHGEMMHADSIHFPDSLKYKTRKLGRTVYGGGGIMPDIFVPVDTTSYSKFYGQLRDKAVITLFTIQEVDHNRAAWMSKYKNFETFNREFTVTDEMLKRLLEKAESEKITFDEKGYQTSLSFIKTQIKALIARDLWSMSEYFEIINPSTPSFARAVKLLQSGQ